MFFLDEKISTEVTLRKKDINKNDDLDYGDYTQITISVFFVLFFVVVDILTPGTTTVAGLDWSCDTLRVR